MKKKAVFKTLGILFILAGLVLCYLTAQGIIKGNQTYDLFRKIGVRMKDFHSETDEKGLEAVKDDYRNAFAAVDQLDGLGGKKALIHVDNAQNVYGLIDTIEATEKIVTSAAGIGMEAARENLKTISGAIAEADRVFAAVQAAGTENAETWLSDAEAALSGTEDPETARAELDEKYANPEEETVNPAKAFFDFVFEMAEETGTENALHTIRAAISEAESGSVEFVRRRMTEQAAAGADQEAVTRYTEEVFRLIADQGSDSAVSYLENLLDTMEQKGIPDARAYLNEVYKDNPEFGQLIDGAFQVMDAQGVEYAKLHGGDICAPLNLRNAESAQAVLTALEAPLRENDGSAAGLNRVLEVIKTAGEDAGGSRNPYLTDLYAVYGEADKTLSAAIKAQEELDEALADAEEARGKVTKAQAELDAAAAEEKEAAQKALDKVQKELDKAVKKVDSKQKIAAKRVLDENRVSEYTVKIGQAAGQVTDAVKPENREKEKLLQNHISALIGKVGLERAARYTDYACQKPLEDKTLRIDRLGTDNAQQLDALDETGVTLMRNKAPLMMLAALCLIAGIALICIRPAANDGIRLSREERKSAGQHMGLRTSRAIANTAIHIVLILISIIWLIPFISILLQSLRVESTHQVGYIMPEKLGFYNYIDLFTTDFPRWYTNTFIMALVVAVLQTVIVLCMSYTLSRFRFKMRKGLMRFMLILGMFPGMLTMIILYRVLSDLGMTQKNAVPGLILVYVASSGMGYYVSKGFFDTIPKSLDEAARVDGATRAQVLMKIILPLAKPIVIYTILTAFMGPWGDYVFARYISFGTSAGMNVAVGLNNWLSKDQIASRYTMFCAGGVLVAIPVAVLFMCLQKYYVEGVTGGAVKG